MTFSAVAVSCLAENASSSVLSCTIDSQLWLPLRSREKVSLTSMMRARFSARSTERASQKMHSAWRASSGLSKHPRVFRPASLRGIDDERALAQSHPREPSGQHPGGRAGDREGSQVDMSGFYPAIDQGRRDRQVDAGLADV